MEFFNKKEEVINVELTQFGKHKLSRGKFKPHYYAFFDDDIIYDVDYANYQEMASEVHTRIKDETPRLKSQYVFSSVEDEIKKLNEFVSEQIIQTGFDPIEADNVFDENLQKHFNLRQFDNQYIMMQPLGTSDYMSNYAPAWDITLLHGKIRKTATAITGSDLFEDGYKPTVRIPQLDIDLKYKTFFADEEVEQKDFPLMTTTDGDASDDHGSDMDALGAMNYDPEDIEEGKLIPNVHADYLLFEIAENNVSYTKENFDFEIYEIVENESGKEELKSLFFSKGGYIEEELTNLGLFSEEELETDLDSMNPEYADYYMKILKDDEIPASVICANISNSPDDRYLDRDFDCRQYKRAQKTDVVNVYDTVGTVSSQDSEEAC